MPRVLYISGSIGLGHAARDLAIADQLRRLQPTIEVDWLAGEPAKGLIEEAGETTVLAESAAFGETDFAEAQAEEFSLNIIWYVARAAGAWVRAARAYFKAVANPPYDFVIGGGFETRRLDGGSVYHFVYHPAPRAVRRRARDAVF